MTNIIRQLYKAMFSYESRLWLYKIRHADEYRRLRTVVHPSEKGNFSLRPFDENRCIFVHITKTAGTSVATSLFNYLPYHYTAVDYRVIYGKKTFNQYFKFAFVRNPWDRLYSAYRYLKSGGWNEKDKKWAEQNLNQFDSFGSFVKQWLTKENIKKHRHFWPQYLFVCDNKKRIIIDYLAYFETIEDDFDRLCGLLKIEAALGRHNANPGNDYRDAYDAESRNLVAEVYSTDIELFGYDFNGIKQRTLIKK
jgi:hypothetical protein